MKIWAIEPYGLKTDAVARINEVSKHLDAEMKVVERKIRIEGQSIPVYFVVIKTQ